MRVDEGVHAVMRASYHRCDHASQCCLCSTIRCKDSAFVQAAKRMQSHAVKAACMSDAPAKLSGSQLSITKLLRPAQTRIRVTS